MAGAAQDEVDEIRAPQIGYGTPTWREVAPTHFRASRPMAKTSSFLSEDGITEATTAVLLVRCVGSAAELSTNRSSFFSPAANAGVPAGAAAAKTRSVLNRALHVTSHPKTVSTTSYFLSRRTRETDNFCVLYD